MTVTSPFRNHACNVILIFKKRYSPRLASEKVDPKANFWQKVGRDVTKDGEYCISTHTQTVWAAPTHIKICFERTS